MNAQDRHFTTIIDGTKQFVIPVFQRDYIWTDRQCEQLWKDIQDIARDKSDHGHFLGSVVCVSTEDSSPGFTKWLLIDGQQRLATLTLLLTALRDHIQATGWHGGEDGPDATRIEAYFLKNVYESASRRHKLLLRRHDHDTLRALLDKDDIPTTPSVRIKDAYDCFRDKLAQADPNADPRTVYRGIGRLVVVDVTLDRRTDDPQLIFESLNSTGVDLSQSDLIRNYLLLGLEEKEQTRLYDSYWSKLETLFRGREVTFDAFFRDYIALKTKASKQEKATEIYRGFRASKLTDQLGGLEALLKDLLRFGRYHAAFSIGTTTLPDLADTLARLRNLLDVPAPLIMRLFDCYERSQTLTAHSFNEALVLIESYIFRRAISGAQTRGYWQTFANLAHRIDEHKPLESLKVGLYRLKDTVYRFPVSEEFYLDLQQRDLYALRVCKYLLDRLENHGSKELTDTRGYTIEHILPQNDKLPAEWREMLGADWQNVQRTWLHRLGNLTLTGYNPKYSDLPFNQKKTIEHGFNQSAVRLNEYVRKQNKWTAVEIKDRGEYLAGRALKIWPSLEIDPAIIEAAAQAELQERAAKSDITKVPMSKACKDLFDAIRPHILEISPNVLELAEGKSVSYHAPSFFLEVIPRKHGVFLLLALDYSDIKEPPGLVEDLADWKFIQNAKYDGGAAVKLVNADEVELALPIIRQAYTLANS